MSILVCPACGQIHVDEGEWAIKPHRTHRCVRGIYGVGCEHEWEAHEKGIGTDEIGAAHARGLVAGVRHGLEYALQLNEIADDTSGFGVNDERLKGIFRELCSLNVFTDDDVEKFMTLLRRVADAEREGVPRKEAVVSAFTAIYGSGVVNVV